LKFGALLTPLTGSNHTNENPCTMHKNADKVYEDLWNHSNHINEIYK